MIQIQIQIQRAYQQMLDERALAHAGDETPIWLPDFPEAQGGPMDEDEWGAL